MINSIQHFQEQGVKNLTEIFSHYTDDLTKFAEMVYGVTKEVTKLGLSLIEEELESYLQNFREETFFRKHPKFSFTAVGEKEKEYCVVSVLETDKYADYYSFTDYGNEEDYCRMVEKILSHSKFQSEAAKKMKNEIEESGAEAFFRNYQFVTLSTCRTMDGKDKRLMVIGCRKR